MKLKKGDKVVVIAGSEKGKEATIVKILREKNQVVLEGLNMRKKAVKASGDTPGQILEFAAPVNASNVALIDPKTNKATRVGMDRSGEKPVRIARKSDTKID